MSKTYLIFPKILQGEEARSYYLKKLDNPNLLPNWLQPQKKIPIDGITRMRMEEINEEGVEWIQN